MRLIDGDALVEFWSADFTEEEIHKLRIPLVVAIENIKDAPTVDAVAVVQCKDCKHFQSFKGVRAKVNTDKSGWCDINDDSVRAYDYCSYGERRTRMRMQTQDFIDLAKHITESELYDANPDIQGAHDVAVVWFCKTLQNMKALLCVPSVQDGKYYEATYNGDKDELYFDVYKKQINMKFDSGDIDYYLGGCEKE